MLSKVHHQLFRHETAHGLGHVMTTNRVSASNASKAVMVSIYIYQPHGDRRQDAAVFIGKDHAFRPSAMS